MTNLAKIIGAALVILLSIFWIFHSTRPPKGSASNHEYAGAALARELAKHCGERGGKFLVVGFAGERRTLNQQIDGFLGEMKAHANFEDVGREDIDPAAAGDSMMEGAVPPAAFAGCLRSHANADIIVSFVGLPDLRDERIASAIRTGKKLVVINARSPDLRELIEKGIVYMAIVTKSVNMADFTKSPSEPAAWFDRFFEIVAAQPASK